MTTPPTDPGRSNPTPPGPAPAGPPWPGVDSHRPPYVAASPPGEPPSKATAGWALGLAIVPCCFGVGSLVAIALAITVLVRSRDGADHGRAMAIAALVIAPLWIIGSVATGVVTGFLDGQEDADRDDHGRIVTSQQMSLLKVRTGDCFNSPDLAGGEGALQVEAVPCSRPHQFETYYDFEVPDPGSFPGEDELSGQTAQRCLQEFRPFVGVAYRRSRLESYNLYPTAASWRLYDDRSAQCVLQDPAGAMSGSARGSRR